MTPKQYSIPEIVAMMRAYSPKADEYGGVHIIPFWADRIEACEKTNAILAERNRYRDALNDIQARIAAGYFVDTNHIASIASNALKGN